MVNVMSTNQEQRAADIQEKLKEFIGTQATQGTLDRIKAYVQEHLLYISKQTDFRYSDRINFSVEQDRANPTSIVVKPTDLYSALVFKFFQSGLPGVCVPPPPEMVTDKWMERFGFLITKMFYAQGGRRSADAVLKKVYRVLAADLHPDSGGEEETMKQLSFRPSGSHGYM